jgi:OFA family oxalate/formate antiporter-like MFS transporter
MIPLVCSWEYFPEKKGLVTGIIVGAYGFGSFIFTFLSAFLVNPDDVSPSICVTTGESTICYFTPDIANNVRLY